MRPNIRVLCTGRGTHPVRDLAALRDNRLHMSVAEYLARSAAPLDYLARLRAGRAGADFDPEEAERWKFETAMHRLQRNGIAYIETGSRMTRSGRWIDNKEKPTTHVVEDASGRRTVFFNCPTCNFPARRMEVDAERLFDEELTEDFDISRL